jgi:transglutaminase-like putative cysteine protease
MKFKIQSSITYEVHSATTFIFNIHALRTPSQTVIEEQLTINPDMRIEEYTSPDGNSRFVRLRVNPNTIFTISYVATVDMHHKVINEQNSFHSVQVENLDSYIVSFLFPSRYCQSDKLQKLAYKEFGHINNVYSTVLAITDWIYNNVDYSSGSTDSQTSAIDTITERVGVCRDFAHLGIAFCRAMSIPARYFTGYAYQLSPPDFHACFEAYIDGNWIIFDATRLVPLNGLVKIATGRDAADAAVASIFGNAQTTAMQVVCEVLDQNFLPFWYQNGSLSGLSFQ